MEPGNFSPHLDYTRLLFSKKQKNNNKPNNNTTTTLATQTANNGQSMEALELMRTLLTSQFENEIMETCDKYMELFRKAASNIQTNQGEEVPQVSLNTILQSMLKSTRSAVTRRYSDAKQLTSVTRGRKITRRTIKVARHKPRTLQNLKMDWYKQIRAKGCYLEDNLEESRMENTGDEVVSEIDRNTSPVVENHIDEITN